MFTLKLLRTEQNLFTVQNVQCAGDSNVHIFQHKHSNMSVIVATLQRNSKQFDDKKEKTAKLYKKLLNKCISICS